MAEAIDDHDLAREEFEQSILSVDTKIVKDVLLSTGGPADFFRFYIDPEDQTITRISYHFQDWADGAVRTLDAHEFDMVANLFDWLTLDLDINPNR